MKSLVILLILLLSWQCRTPPTQLNVFNNKKSKLVLNEYSKNTLHLYQYVFLNDSVVNRFEFTNINGQDSVLGLFLNAMCKIQAPVKIMNPLNNRQHPHISNFTYGRVKSKRLHDSVIINICNYFPRQEYVLLPILHTFHRRFWSLGGNSLNTYGQWWGSDGFTCIIYIIKDGEIKYKREARQFAMHKEDEKISAHDAYTSRLKPEHWDTLVYKVMEDYMKRIKK